MLGVVTWISAEGDQGILLDTVVVVAGEVGITGGEDVIDADEIERAAGTDVIVRAEVELTGGTDVLARRTEDCTGVTANRRRSRLLLMRPNGIGVRREVVLVGGDLIDATPYVERVILDVIHTAGMYEVIAVIDERDGDTAGLAPRDFVFTICCTPARC